MSRPRIVTDESFDRDVLRSAVPVLVSFFAPWCTPCRSTAAVAGALADEFSDRLLVARVDTDTSPVTAATYSADHVPACLLFWEGTPVKAIPSHLPAAALRAQINAAIPLAQVDRRPPPGVSVDRPRA